MTATSFNTMKRSFFAALTLALLIVIGLWCAPGIEKEAEKTVAANVESLRSSLESALGLRVSFGALAPAILRSASFSDLRLTADDGRVVFSANHVSVGYDLIALILGRGSVLSSLDISGAIIDIHLPEDQNLLDRFKGSSKTSVPVASSAAFSLPRLSLSGRDVTIRIQDRAGESVAFIARKVAFSSLGEEPSILLDGMYSISAPSNSIKQLSGALNLSGSISRDFGKARASLAISASSSAFSLAAQRFEMIYGDSELTLTKVKDRSPLDAVIKLSFAGRESSLLLSMERYYPSRNFRLFDSMASFEPWLELPYSGTLSVKARGLDLSTLTYSMNLASILPSDILPGSSSPISANIALDGDSHALHIAGLRINREEDFISYAGSFRFSDLAPNGVLDLNLSPARGFPTIAASMQVVSQDGEYALLADRLSFGQASVQDFTFTASRKTASTDFALSFRPAAVGNQDSSAYNPAMGYSGEAGEGSVSSLVRCEGSLAMGSSPNIELSMDLDGLALSPYKPLFAVLLGDESLANSLATLKLGGSLFLTSDFKRVSWTASDLTIVSSLVPGAFASLNLSGTSTSLQVKNALISASGYSIRGKAQLDFSDASKLGFEANFTLADIPYTFKGSASSDGLFLTGDYGLALAARKEDSATLVSARMKDLPVKISGGVYLASLDVEGQYVTTADWNAQLLEFALRPSGSLPGSLPSISLAGDFAPTKALLSSIEVSDKISALEGNGELQYNLAKPFSAKLSANLAAKRQGDNHEATAAAASAGPSSHESYALALSYSDSKIEGSLNLSSSPLARLGNLPLDGSVDGRVLLSGSVDDPTLDFSLSLRNASYQHESLLLSCSGSYARQTVSLRDLVASFQGQSLSGVTGHFSMDTGSADLNLRYSGDFGGKACSFSLVALGRSAEASPVSLGSAMSDYSLAGQIQGFTMGKQSLSSWPFSLSIAASGFTFVGGTKGEARFRYGADGLISASLRQPFPIVAECSGLYDGKRIDISVQGLELDMGMFSQFLPSDLISVSSGRAHGGFTASGLASDPDITGEIDLENVNVKAPGYLADAVGPFSAPIVAIGRRLSIAVPRAQAGSGLVSLQCQASFDHWAPVGIVASIQSLPENPIRLDTKIMGVHVQGDADLALKAQLNGDIVAISTDITLQKATVRITQEVFDSGNASSAAPSPYLQVAASIHFGRSVQLVFAPISIPILSGYADPASAIAIRFDQSDNSFSFKGKILLRGGDVFYGSRSFFIKEGDVVFNENADSFDPRLTIQAELRDHNEYGPVVITLRTDNVPMSNFTPVLSADPLLSQSQILAIIGLSKANGTADDSSLDLKKAVVSGMDLIPAQINPLYTFENSARDLLGLDMLYLRSGILGQWLTDFVQQRNTSTLGDYFDESEIYVGKYVANSIFLHGAVSLNSVTSSTPLVSANNLIINSEVGVEMDAPFGRITWTLAPANGWNNLQLSDQSLSLSWRFSY